MKKITLLTLFVVASLVGTAQTVIFSEDFSNVTTTASADANGNISGTVDISATLDTEIGTPGWTGTKVYPSDGMLKLGSSSAQGSITTPEIDLSVPFNLSVDLRSWKNNNGGEDTGHSILVQLDGVTIDTITYTITMATYTLDNITGGTATSKITFAAIVGKNRFFIDNIVLTSVTSNLSHQLVSNTSAYISGSELIFGTYVAKGTVVELFNLTGAKILSTQAEGTSMYIGNLPKGLYMARIGNKTEKVVVR